MTIPIWKEMIHTLASLLVVFNYGMLLMGVMAKVVARVHGRIGPPVLQPYIDLVKTFSIRTGINHGVMFFLGPVFRLAGGVGLYLLMPVVYGSVWLDNYSVAGDLLLVIYFIFFGMLGMALGAAESGHPYSAMGIMRGLSQVTASEVPFALSVIALAAQHQTLNLHDLVSAQQGSIWHWNLFTNPLATLAGMISFFGMMMRAPFNLHLAPQEIPIGPPTEYQATSLSFMAGNRAFFASAKLVLFMNLFFGGATSLLEMVLKTFLLYFLTVFVSAVSPRFRLEQSVRFFLKIPTAIGILAIVVTTWH
jgi:NADH-quinone oxidoreductase subunit H